MSGILVYNLYPRLIGKFSDMKPHALRAKEMEFEYIYLNPLAAPGFSGSSYAIKDYYLYHPMHTKGWPVEGEAYSDASLKKEKKVAEKELKAFVKYCEEIGLKVMLDLVINHTAIDSNLVKEHKEWYLCDEDGNIENPGADQDGTFITWGDLASLDNDNKELWTYWLDLIKYYISLGIRGFRCDAAYHIPEELWKYLISNAKKIDKEIVFLGETLGCTPEELMVIGDSGFDVLMNSLKWWDYKAPWFLKDYNLWSGNYNSLCFPENHDTLRYAKEFKGNKEKAVFIYNLQALFCSSIGITLGFEFGFEKKLDVVTTNPEDFEDVKYSIVKELREINELKKKYKIFNEDNNIETIFLGDNLFTFRKISKDKKENLVIIANLNENNWERVEYYNFNQLFNSEIKDISIGHKMEVVPNNLEYHLKPYEIKVFYSKE